VEILLPRRELSTSAGFPRHFVPVMLAVSWPRASEFFYPKHRNNCAAPGVSQRWSNREKATSG